MIDLSAVQFDSISIELAVHVPPFAGDPIHLNRPSHGFAFHRDGETTYTFDNGNSLTLHSNTIIYLPKGSNYTVHSKPSAFVEIGTYAINFNTFGELKLPEFKLSPVQAEKVFTSFRDAEIAWRTKPVGYYETCCKMLYDIILRLKQQTSAEYTPSKKSSLIAPALDYIHQNYTLENISITKLASLCDISEVYLRKLFHLVYGMSPIKYINSLKLLRAKELIDSGEVSIGTAALQSGFFNTSYFSREFKKEFGTSPTEYGKK